MRGVMVAAWVRVVLVGPGVMVLRVLMVLLRRLLGVRVVVVSPVVLVAMVVRVVWVARCRAMVAMVVREVVGLRAVRPGLVLLV